MTEPTIYDFSVKTIDGRDVGLSEFAGRALLIVNTASQCGFTPQYRGLQDLHSAFGPRGFSVLGFPCNQFGGQEPGNEQEIAAFCDSTYGVTFPLFAKVDVNGPKAHPLFRFLKTKRRGLLGSSRIKWNFTKFLVDRSGRVTARYAPTRKPEKLKHDIAALL